MTSESVKFDRAVEYYDQTRGFPPGEEKPIAAMLAQVGGLTHSSRVLEIGIGTGRIALPLSAHVGAYYGIDISRPMMMKLQAKHNGEAVYPAEGDATRLPFPDRKFDAAIVVHVFHLIPNWQDALDELARVLRPGAQLIHCWTEDEDSLSDIWRAWNAAIGAENRHVGARWQQNPHFLEDEGWQPTGEPLTHAYKVTRTPHKLPEIIKKRIWSALWSVSDEDIERGLAIIQPMIEAEYPDPDTTIEGQSVVFARAYLPPQ
jgi:ubiquinone/menaquinone biosynthesis C-methylase UbiE